MKGKSQKKSNNGRSRKSNVVMATPLAAAGPYVPGQLAMMVKRGKGRPKGSTVPIERRLNRYKNVDWSNSDAEISKQLLVSREAVRQARNVLFGPPPRDRRLRIPRGARIDPVSGYVVVTPMQGNEAPARSR